MKNSFKLFVAALAFVGFAANANAQATDAASATASAKIITPISVTNVENSVMHFGSIIPSGTFGYVYLSPAGVITTTTSGLIVMGNSGPNAQNPPSAAQFAVTGEPDFFYAITFGSYSISLTGPGAPMTVDQFWTNIGGSISAGGGVGQLSNAGTQNFSVGADVHVGANQAPGNYAGTFNVHVTYQ